MALALGLSPSPPPQAAILIGPYVQDVRPDGFTVVFETSRPAEAVVEAGGERAVTRGTRHEATLKGLAPGQRYRYRVLLGGVERASAEVGTAPAGGTTLDFDVYGDTRAGGAIEGAIVAEVLADHPDLVLYTGDMVWRGSDSSAWHDFFAEEEPLLRQVPIYPTVGNHEVWQDATAAHFRHYFVLPDRGRERLYYSFRFGPARFVVLNGNAVTAEQTAWLASTLAAADHEPGVHHLFVLMHQPPFSVGDHCGSAVAEAAWVRLFEQHHVSAVFAGHDHAYERLARNGVAYFISGGGGAGLYAERTDCPRFDEAARQVYLPVHHHLRVRVSGDDVEVTALALGDRIIDRQSLSIKDAPTKKKGPALAGAAPLHLRHPWWIAGAAALVLLALWGWRRRA